MTSFFIICFVAGGVGAILQGMIGIGTGVIIVPLLSMLLPFYGVPIDHAMHIALATSMSAIAINAISALRSHLQQQNIEWRLLKKLMLFSLVGAFVGAQLANQLSGTSLQMVFGLFMLTLSVYLIRKKPVTESADAVLPQRGQLALGGFFIGALASLVGSGGGVLMVPFLRRLQLTMRHAVGTSTLLGFPIAMVGAFTYVFASTSVKPASEPVYWIALIAMTFAGMLGAPWGVTLARRWNSMLLQRVFAVVMMLVAVRMLAS